jgi:SAM-dependent methyltransferase
MVASGEAALMGRFALDRTLLNRGFPTSSWGNLGLWTSARDYPAACEALATRLAERAQLQPGCSVLDVGFGHGDQLLLWKQRFRVGRITGLELDEAGLTEARRKLAAFDDVALRLAGGDPEQREECYDRVLALDCAYHFAPRSAFFARSLKVLNPGGVLGVTDLLLCGEGDHGAGPLRSRLALACGIPPENLLTRDAYAGALIDLGYSDVRIDLLDDAVLGGFARFALRHLRMHGALAWSTGWLKILVSAAAGTWLRRANQIHYVLVTATRSSAAMVSR